MTKTFRPSAPGLVLVVVTALAVAGVAYVLGTQKSRMAPAFTPKVMFADLQGQLDSVDRLAIQSQDASFDIVKSAQGDWVIPQIAQYPAAPDAVRTALLGLAELELIEFKTARPERYPALGLGAPQDGGRGTELVVWRGETELAHLIVGDEQQAARPGMPAQFFVRTSAADQTWAARGRLDLGLLAIDWIERSVLELERNDIAALHVMPPEGADYTLSRTSADEADVVLASPSEGRDPQPAYTLNISVFAPVGLMVEDVRLEEEVDFSAGGVTRAVYTTFSGVVLELSLLAHEETYWMKAEASFVPLPIPPSEEELLPESAEILEEESAEDVSAVVDVIAAAAALNRRLSGFVFAIPKFKYDQMTKSLEDLLEPLSE